jgi:hypothetical protein
MMEVEENETLRPHDANENNNNIEPRDHHHDPDENDNF